jgi:predicted transcriptional regulator
LKLSEVQRILGASVLVDAYKLDKEVEMAFGADLMSDILAMCREHTMILTGMTNIQVIRTAEMSDLAAVVFVRGKEPGQEVIEMAESIELPLLSTKLTMYEAAGLLYSAGLSGINKDVEPHRRIVVCEGIQRR